MSTSPYTVLTTLYGHTSSINVIRSSPDGKHLASGGDDGTIIVYSTKTWGAVKRYGNFSPVTALVWHPTIPSVIIFGCKNGDVQTVHFRDPEGGDTEYRRVWVDWMKDPVACIAMDVDGTLAAISHGAEITVVEQPTISVWRGMKTLHAPPSVTSSEDTIPAARSLHFLKDDSLLVSYLEHGIVCWDTKLGSVKWNIVPRVRYIGRSCISPDGKFVVVSNMYDGVDFYSIPSHAFSHTVLYRVNPHVNSPIPVEFIPDGRTLLIGGTYGSARMIDTQTSETIQLLPHSGDLIQALNVHRSEDGGWVVSVGVSELGNETAIKVWSSKTGKPPGRDIQPAANAAGERVVEVPERPRRGLLINVLSVLLLVASVFIPNNPDGWFRLTRPVIRLPPFSQDHGNADEIWSAYEAALTASMRMAMDVPIAADTPIATDVPAVTDIPIATDLPVVTDTPNAADVPAVTDTPIATDVPAVTDTPTAADTPADAPAARDTPIGENTKIETDTPVSR